jgi:hypothetical protein
MSKSYLYLIRRSTNRLVSNRHSLIPRRSCRFILPYFRCRPIAIYRALTRGTSEPADRGSSGCLLILKLICA